MIEANRRFVLRSLALGAGSLCAAKALAGDETIKLALGAGSLIALDAPFESVLIGDPSVVDVSRQTDRTVILKGLGCGASNVVFLDAKNMAIANFRVVVSEARA